MADTPQTPKKKKRILLTILIAVPLILLLFIGGAVGILYMQYNSLSYAPSDIVTRTDLYVLPDYPEIIPGSEGITDFPDVTELPTDTAEPVTSETDSPVTVAPPEETSVPDTTAAETTAETTTAETAAAVTTTAPPETLPSVTYAPPVTTAAPSDSAQAAPGTVYTPVYNRNNSFANAANAVNVYGKVPIYEVEKIDEDIINILVLGTDSRDVTIERGRSDTMIVISYNEKTGTVRMVSFLRDALVPIEGHDWNRINTAYAFGGVGLAINTVNQLFGLDIQHFVVVDFNGAKNFIDYIGGVEVSLTAAEAKYYGLKEGKQTLTGAQAMVHMRNRSTDNDFGRTRRQRDVITAMIGKILTEKSLTEIYDIAGYAMGLVKTNIPATTLTGLAASVAGNASKLSIDTQNVPFSDSYQFAWYNKMAILSFDIHDAAERVYNYLYE